MSLTYNVNHIQVGEAGETPVFVDVNGAIALEPTIESATDDIRGDGEVWATVYGATTGSLSMTWLQTNFAVLAEINGGIVSSSGTGATAIERYELPGQYIAPVVVVSSWEPNVAPDKSPDEAGLRTTIPAAQFAPAAKASGQESVGEWSAEGTFKSTDGAMIIYELMATAPEFTNGVMPVLLDAPTP